MLWYLLEGGRLIDTAHIYGNHRAIGDAIREAGRRGVPRSEVAEAPWSGAEWAVALSFDNPGASVLVMFLGGTPLRVLGFQTPKRPLQTTQTPQTPYMYNLFKAPRKA